jgi:hypothetical protein
MLRFAFEPTIPAFERAKTIHALDPATTVIGIGTTMYNYLQLNVNCSLMITCSFPEFLLKTGYIRVYSN